VLAVLLAAAALFAVISFWLARRPRPLVLAPVEARGLHEGECFAAFASANHMQVDPEGGIAVADRVLAYAAVEALVTGAWQRYAAANPPNTRKPFVRSIKVVLRDWHDLQVGKETPYGAQEPG
jgi:hypothetical protein